MSKFPAPPIRTPFLGNPPQAMIADVQNVPSYPYESWLQNVTLRLSAPVTAVVPATSASPGVTGQVERDANFLYVCVATNTWKRIALAAF